MPDGTIKGDNAALDVKVDALDIRKLKIAFERIKKAACKTDVSRCLAIVATTGKTEAPPNAMNTLCNHTNLQTRATA